MNTNRIYVEKRPEFGVEAESLRKELNSALGLGIGKLRMLCVYDLFGFDADLLEKTRYGVFGEKATDTVTETPDLGTSPHIAVEALPASSTSVHQRHASVCVL